MITFILNVFVFFFLQPEWKLADPICTFLFSVLVLFTTLTILKDILMVLMEGKYKGVNSRDCIIEWISEHFL